MHGCMDEWMDACMDGWMDNVCEMGKKNRYFSS